MGMRSSTLANNPLAVVRELDGRYDAVLKVKDNLPLIEEVAGVDFAAIMVELASLQDFTGITVVTGPVTSWNPNTKVLTVATVKGDTGATGAKGDTGERGLTGLRGANGSNGVKGDKGLDGLNGASGVNGLNGMIPILQFSLDVDGDLSYEVIGYEEGPTLGERFPTQEW